MNLHSAKNQNFNTKCWGSGAQVPQTQFNAIFEWSHHG